MKKLEMKSTISMRKWRKLRFGPRSNKITFKSLSLFGHVDRLIIERLEKSREPMNSASTICN